MNDIITIDPKQIQLYADEGGKLVFKKEAESELIKLLELQKMIEEKVEMVKTMIAESGQAIDDGFKGVIGEKIRATFRLYGEKYTYKLNSVPDLKDFLKEKIYYKVDSDRVDEYFKAEGKLPDGISEKPRSPSLTITMK